ncbi:MULTISPECIES: hypothetical protein [unclassified Actinobaculum]|uniref:hypothetical protein n=1 Tax=unclassified Actinobaculum TaxID=2609299 RepID=UPI000D525E8B|nr:MULTISPECIES: hypothetical protein [unclassified Actinobaculum]AWE41918.1 hypothetical protein DDD63_03150 [Actinobaculum sp. 313]RTE50168.1 hypothetical protein EKN07_02815 [Actinobaculum sp. 352]
MPDNLNGQLYLQELDHELTQRRIEEPRRTDILREIESLLSDGTTPESLGAPARLAEQLAAVAAPGAEADPDDEGSGANPNLDLNFSGLFDADARARLWDPSSPRLFVKRVFGAGADLNMGAVAVKLGLLRPDDVDDEVLAAIPEYMRRIVRFFPSVLAAGTVAATLTARRRGKRLPLNISLTGKVRGTIDPTLGTALLGAANFGTAIWAAREGDDIRDALIRGSMGSLLNASLLSSALFALKSRDGRIHPLWVLGASAASLAIEPVLLILATRSGLRHVTDANSAQVPGEVR